MALLSFHPPFPFLPLDCMRGPPTPIVKGGIAEANGYEMAEDANADCNGDV